MPPPDENNAILTALSMPNESAGVAFFITLLRTTPILFHWLRVAALTPMCFERLAAVVEQRIMPPKHACAGRKLLVWLIDANGRDRLDSEPDFEPKFQLHFNPELIQKTAREIEQRVQQTKEQKERVAQEKRNEQAKQEAQKAAFLRQQIAPIVAPVAAPTYGGLTRLQMLALVRRYQAGNIDPNAFIIAHAWWRRRARRVQREPGSKRELSPARELRLKQAPRSKKEPRPQKEPCSEQAPLAEQEPRPALLHATALYLRSGLTEDRPRRLHHLALAADFFHGHAPGNIRRAHFGHAAWWRLQLLRYMLRRPKPAYRIGELIKHLQSQRLTVDPKDIRRFCTQHGIARDTSPGRPRNEGEGCWRQRGMRQA